MTAIQPVIDFILELDKLKSVLRKVRPLGEAGKTRFENTAEHTWHIVMFAASLEPFAAEPVDINRVIQMLLVHDIGEIDAGDVMVYAEASVPNRKADELAGVIRVCSLVQEPQRTHFIDLWKEFDAARTPEARFAHAADRAMPALLNLANDGQSWRDHRISYARVVARIGPQIEAGCPALWSYMQQRLADANAAGWFGISAT